MLGRKEFAGVNIAVGSGVFVVLLASRFVFRFPITSSVFMLAVCFSVYAVVMGSFLLACQQPPKSTYFEATTLEDAVVDSDSESSYYSASRR